MTAASAASGPTHLEHQSFASGRSELPLLYVFLGLASIELLVVHLLVSLASSTAAWVLSALTALAIIQVMMIVRRIKHRLTVVSDDGITIRSAKGYELTLPWRQVKAMEAIGMGFEPKGPDVLRASLLSHPNVLVTAHEPFTIRKLGRKGERQKMAFRVDEPDVLLAAAHRLMGHCNA